ncbi:MAG: DUF805 domain-containing protein [Rhizobiaceae bacterium]
MRGEVLHYDDDLGVGFITGTDGQRYGFERGDMRRLIPVTKGTRVEFREDNGRARDIFVVNDRMGNVPAATSVPQVGTGAPVAPVAAPPQHFGRYAVSGETESTGLFSYFVRAFTTNYANFRGRARRKEYWGFFLFWWIAVFVLSFAGMTLDFAVGNLGGYDDNPIITIGVIVLLIVASFLPGLAMSVRRQHDIGLSGWFYLLILVPYVGGLIIFVFSLIPSQKHDNKWGPVPLGVRI